MPFNVTFHLVFVNLPFTSGRCYRVNGNRTQFSHRIMGKSGFFKPLKICNTQSEKQSLLSILKQLSNNYQGAVF